MIIKGNTARLRKIATTGIVLSAVSLFIAFFLRITGRDIHAAYFFMGLFIVCVLTIRAFVMWSSAGYIKLTCLGIYVTVGLRPVFVKWDNISAIEIGELKQQPFLGIIVKDLGSLRKTIQNIALINKENTGYHFCLAGGSLEKPLSEVHCLLQRYLEDEQSRKNLPGEESMN